MTDTLVGLMEQRGFAYAPKTNQYKGFIPRADVLERLFTFNPLRAGVAYLVPCAVDEADFIDRSGNACKVVESQQRRVGVLRDDTNYDFGVFGRGAVHPPYQVTLMQQVEMLTGSILGISGAGLLAQGARAYIEFAMPETLHDDKSGLAYRPNLLVADSMDGSISLTKCLTIQAMICANKLSPNLLEAKKAGRLVRSKHTKNIASMMRLANERDALGLLEVANDQFVQDLHKLLSCDMSHKQRIEVMDIIAPIPERAGRGRQIIENKRDQLMSLSSDPMVEPFLGTAFGEVQRYSTWQHHVAERRTQGRWETNFWRAINGMTQSADRATVVAIETVLS